MKKIIVLCAGIFILSVNVMSQKNDSFYSCRILVEEDSQLKEIGDELSFWLKKGTGKDFNVETLSEKQSGIFIVKKDSQILPEHIKNSLKDKRKEAFVIYSQEPGILIITGNSIDGIQYGVYKYLEILGYRWFFPDENWTVIPSLKNITLKINLVEQPAFLQRDFFGTGGFGGKLPVDPEMKLQKKWALWKKRNFLGGEIRISGHAGESFNVANKAFLLEHPEYLAEINGKRQPWSPGTKPCYSNPGLIDLYVKDRLKKLQSQVNADPDGPGSFAVSVEPSDGGGHCECEECKKIGSVSDRVFSLANHVAREVAKNFPGRFVSLLAYNEHAAVPSIELEPNVYVVVVPYGFQRTGYSGDELIELWSKKTKFFGIYDYWSIPDWNNDLPSLNYLEIPAKKIRFWKKNNAAAFLSESTYSSGAMGITWYLSSRLLWNPDLDERKILEDFYSKAFGQARQPMQRMLERWANSFMLTDHEIALSLRDISESDRLAKSPQVKARINDFKKYVIYLKLFYEYQNAKPGTPERMEAVRNLLNFMWQIYDSTMVHVYRMHQLIVNRYETSDQTLKSEWDFKNKEKWESIKPITESQIDEMIKEGIERYKPYSFEYRTFKTDNLVPFVKTVVSSSEKFISTYSFTTSHSFKFFVPENVENLSFKITIGKRENHPGDKITITDPAGKVLFSQFITPDGQTHDINLKTEKKGVYSMSVYDQKIGFSISFPQWLAFVVVDGIVIPDWQKRVYFYVPSGTKNVAMYCKSVVPVKIYDGDGKEVKYQGTTLIVADVPKGQDGKIWSLSHHKLYTRSPIMLNVPNIFGFSKETMMIPQECLKKSAHYLFQTNRSAFSFTD